MAELQHRYDVALRAARAAGAAAMSFYGTATSIAKADASPVTQADHAANDVIVARLREAFPDDAILSEESRDSAERLGARRVWIVDPLDGTKEFLAQNGEFSIMIGLVEDGEPVLGVVYLPDGDVLFSAARGLGAWVERGGVRARLERAPVDGEPLRLVGSRSHAEPLVLRVQEALGITDVEPCGSVGVKCSRIAEGRRDLYVHPVAFMKEWDTCAPEVILREAGGAVTDCRGEPLRYNKPDPRQPHGILACAPGAAASVVPVVRALYEGNEAAAV
ncbi:MAG TPA: 3'(2'),5'-bisphosphate nucleotidase CysQ [Longimicrobiaceae bacterium]|nr:3'(2'),5'-bisphosphate nucleotidase CysQ [Longimicrobiaceae bacterium]